MSVAKYSASLKQKTQLTRDVFVFHFEKPEGFDFLSGQFVQFIVPNGEKPVLRSYSLCSTPNDPYLEFCVKFLPDGKASNYLKDMQIGETLEFQGPRGLFVHKENGTALSFIATGTGLAPIIGIIRDELENKKNEQEIKLLFGVRHEDDLFWIERLEKLQSKYENFFFDITLSQPKPNGTWSGLKGRVTEHILHHLVSHKFYLCGNAAMVKDVRNIILEQGIDAKNIHFEIF